MPDTAHLILYVFPQSSTNKVIMELSSTVLEILILTSGWVVCSDEWYSIREWEQICQVGGNRGMIGSPS